MLVDGRALGQGDVFETDVCVVGAGPAGITLALELARSGCRVSLLESGGREPSAAAKKLSAGKNVGYWYYSLADTRARAFGGTSVQWLASPAGAAEGWRARPLDPVDFERRADMPYSGWPFGYSELRPFYERAHHVCRLGPYDYAPARWESPDAQRLPLNGRITTAIFQHGFEDFASRYDEVARSERVQLVLNATVSEIETDGPAGGVTSVLVAPRPPVRVPVKARLYVLAAGGIENARLLLLSRRSQPAGLGNGEDLVGRFFMERLTGRIGFIAPPSTDFVGRLDLYRQRKVADTSVKAVLCPSADVLRREGLLNCAFYLVPDSRAGCSDGVRAAATLYRALRRRPLPAGLAAHTGAALRGLPDVAQARAPRRRRQLELVALRVQAEQAPNPESRVSLDEARDPYGLPRARVDWRIGERDRSSIRRVQEILDQELRSRGLGRVENKLGDENPPALFLGSFHHMGTTRMHESPKHGVVDQNCQVHGIRNLFVAGSSVFPTSGFANPTLTIVALSLRLSDHIKAQLAL